MQAVSPVVFANVPGAQYVHDDEAKPLLELNVPARHPMHVESPVAEPKVPGGQRAHPKPFALKVPALQGTQEDEEVVALLLPLVIVVAVAALSPAAHAMQALAPMSALGTKAELLHVEHAEALDVLLYVPEAHFKHV